MIKTLLDKLEAIRKELGSDKVFDVVGRLFEGVSLSEYMEQASYRGGRRAGRASAGGHADQGAGRGAAPNVNGGSSATVAMCASELPRLQAIWTRGLPPPAARLRAPLRREGRAAVDLRIEGDLDGVSHFVCYEDRCPGLRLAGARELPT